MEEEKKKTKKKKKKKPQWRKDLEKKLTLKLVPPIAYQWMKWFDRTALRKNEELLTLEGHEELLDHVKNRKGPVLIALWHNRLTFGPTAYQYCNGRGMYIMVSRSFDGDVIAGTLDRFNNLHAVRGSSSRKGVDKGGREALEKLIEIADAGHDIAITPDGPLGPRYEVKRGVIDLAKATGLPIFPAAANADRVIEARSWDKTRVPFPYARFVYKVAPVIRVSADADEEEMESKRKLLEMTLLELTEYVDAFYGQEQKIYRL